MLKGAASRDDVDVVDIKEEQAMPLGESVAVVSMGEKVEDTLMA